MSESDISYNHQCLIPYQDTTDDEKNCKRYRSTKSSRPVSRKSIFSNPANTSSLDVNVSVASSELKSVDFQSYCTIHDIENSMTINVNGAKIIHQNATGKFLDWLSECFWKCSPGCQELPTMK